MPTIDGAEVGIAVKIRVVENGFVIECGFTTWVASTLRDALRLAGDALTKEEAGW